MNKDEVISLVTHMATLLLSGGATSAYVSGDQATAIASGLGAAIGVGIGVYNHWNMKKVPETAIVK